MKRGAELRGMCVCMYMLDGLDEPAAVCLEYYTWHSFRVVQGRLARAV